MQEGWREEDGETEGGERENEGEREINVYMYSICQIIIHKCDQEPMLTM